MVNLLKLLQKHLIDLCKNVSFERSGKNNKSEDLTNLAQVVSFLQIIYWKYMRDLANVVSYYKFYRFVWSGPKVFLNKFHKKSFDRSCKNSWSFRNYKKNHTIWRFLKRLRNLAEEKGPHQLTRPQFLEQKKWKYWYLTHKMWLQTNKNWQQNITFWHL